MFSLSFTVPFVLFLIFSQTVHTANFMFLLSVKALSWAAARRPQLWLVCDAFKTGENSDFWVLTTWDTCAWVAEVSSPLVLLVPNLFPILVSLRFENKIVMIVLFFCWRGGVAKFRLWLCLSTCLYATCFCSKWQYFSCHFVCLRRTSSLCLSQDSKIVHLLFV